MAPDREQLQRRLAVSERRLVLALQAAGMAAWEWTGTDDVWTDDLYELLGLPQTATASTELFFSRVHPADLPRLKQDWQRAVTGKDAYESEFRILLPDGTLRWLKGVGDLVRDPSGEVIRIYGLNWDITQQKEQEEERERLRREAQAASEAKSEFLATMSHEIRTPLSAILAYAALLERRVQDDKALDYARRIARNGNALLDIVNDILDMSQVESGRTDIESGPVDVSDLLEEVRKTMEARAIQKGLDLEVRIEGPMPARIRSDAKRLRQILINLVGNALKFTEEGSVRVVCRYQPGTSLLRIEVIDTGIGIPPEGLDEVFQPFERGARSHSRRYEGSGLGLTVARRLADLLGGDLTVRSEVDQGSTFVCTVAAEEFSEERHAEGDRLGSAAEGTASLQLEGRVLVIDEHREHAAWCANALRSAGLEVALAEGGSSALRLVEARPAFDLVILDPAISGTNGFEVAERLRQLGHRTPLVALTDDVLERTRRRATELGFARFLTRPVTVQTLLEAVRQELGR